MRKKKLGKHWFFLGALCLLAAALWHLVPDWEGAEEMPVSSRIQTKREIEKAAQLLVAAPSVDTAEQCLGDAGLGVLDTDAVYPEYLRNPEELASFWEAVSNGQDGKVSLFRVLEDGGLRHLLFLREQGGTWFYTTEAVREEMGKVSILKTERLPVYDMELTDWGIFYYRCYPAGDPHYIDYSQIRMESVDREGYDLARKYILPISYQMVNLFLVDWQEGNWGTLSFADTLEFLYGKYQGKYLPWEQYPGSTSRVWVPAEVFEETILPYFAIDPETFRSLCDYDAETGSYPWKPVHGDDLTAWEYPMCEPEVISWQENGDGTLTLQVQVYCPDLKLDRLFCHEVTVRPLEAGFQYVSNRVTHVSDYGLPPTESRFQLAG